MLTHVTSTKIVAKDNAELIKGYFGFDDLQYSGFIYEMGLKFLERMYEHPSNPLFQRHESSKLFWQWYKNNFRIGENQFIKLLKGWENKGYSNIQIGKKYAQLMYFHCVTSVGVKQAFDNYLKMTK